MNNTTTTNLAEFGHRELAIVRDLLSAMIENGLPNDFYDNEVVPMFNKYSGNVFLTNSECEVAMLNGNNELESFYWLSYHGYEGFLDDLLTDYDNGNILSEDWEELADICERNGKEEKAEKIRKALEEL